MYLNTNSTFHSNILNIKLFLQKFNFLSKNNIKLLEPSNVQALSIIFNFFLKFKSHQINRPP